MSRISYVNGQFVPHISASVHIEDRGYQFSDGVYEVISVQAGRLLDETPHLSRLERSLDELRMNMPVSPVILGMTIREVVRRNRLRNGYVYIQVSRGVSPRDHGFPDRSTPESLIVAARYLNPKSVAARADKGITVVTTPDIRWGRCDIKTIGLLANVLAKQEAREAGAYEAWFVDRDGLVTEGSSSNAWILTADNELLTRHLDERILPGITRATLLRVIGQLGIRLVERPFTPLEAQSAKEAFMTSASAFVLPIVGIDDAKVGDGQPGPVSKALRAAYFDAAQDT